jgi:ubiquinone/menaquinone biosynthesis C-methylase UbiE
MSDTAQAIYFYTRHPISAAIILAKLRASRGNLDGVRPDELFSHDQDHYGGLAVNDALATAARIIAGSRIADFCAGLGGPARYLAHRYGADVTGIELTPARVAGAAELTRLVGLQDRVRVLDGDVTEVPLADSSMDAVVSQEAMLHVPDKGRALAEAFRILKAGGRLAFTDWTLHVPLSETDADLLWRGMAAQTLQSVAGYSELLRRVGFRIVSIDDLTVEWGVILAERLAMYRKLREEAERAGTPVGHDAFHESYVRFVALVQAGDLGGARFTAEKS